MSAEAMARHRWTAVRLVGSALLLLLTQGIATAQQSLGVDPTGRSGKAPPPLLEEQSPSAPQWTLPPPPLPPADSAGSLSGPRVFVREVRLEGNTAIPNQELVPITTPYTNREVSAEELEALRLAITQHYVNRGYVNSGAILPEQTVRDGVVALRIIEGNLTRIEVEGNTGLRSRYIESRLALDAKAPVNLNALQQRLQLLQQDGHIHRVNAELRPGVRLGESVLHVRVDERVPYGLSVAFNNYQSPTVGAERGLLTLSHQNLTGNGDRLSVTYGRSVGVDPQLDAEYTFPLTARDTTLSLRYRKNEFFAIEAPFDPLDIESQSNIYSLSLRHPLFRSLDQELAVSLTGERLESTTLLLGTPFSFSPGVQNGKSRVTAVRTAVEWTRRQFNQVLALRSQFSVGVDVWNATINGSSQPDGQFFAWLGQFQWARRFGERGIQTLLRADLQLANKSLLPLEQIAVGGRYTVRGYRENTLVRDNAFLSSFETAVPVVSNQWWADTVQLVPFVDFGSAWNTKEPTPSPRTLASIGMGLRWGMTIPWRIPVTPQFEIYWGLPLRNAKNIKGTGGDLQDQHLHMQFVLTAF